MKNLILAVLITLLVGSASAHAESRGEKCWSGSTDEFCKLPMLETTSADHGYVVATGHWTPKGYFSDVSETEITCIRALVPQVSNSKIGYCLMATGFVMDGTNNIGVSTVYLDITSWEKTKIIAEQSPGWEATNCESQAYVIDFSSNTVTMTSTLSISKECNQQWGKLGKPVKQVENFRLVHQYGTMYADERLNPFLK